MNTKTKISSFIKQNKYTTCVFVLLFICCALFRISATGIGLATLVFTLVNISFFYIFLDLFIRFRLQLIFILVISLLATTDVVLFYIYRDVMNYEIAAAIFETDQSEAFNMLWGAIPLIVISFGLFLILFYKSSCEIKKRKRLPLIFSVSYLVVAILIVPVYLRFREEDRSANLFFRAFKIAPHIYLAGAVPVKYPFVTGDLFLYTAYFREMAKFRESAAKEKVLPKDIVLDKTAISPTKIVFIIGESALRTHMSVYGYDIKTTPFLDSIAFNTTKLTHYDEIVSPAGYTRDAIRMALSFATASNSEPFLEEKNVINLANDAGYKSFWFSTQGKFGVDDSYVGMLAACAQESDYIQGLIKDDHSLIPFLQSALVPKEKQFVVLHLTGSHVDYTNRYDEVDVKSLESKGKTIEYDRSIHHTDRLLRMVYQSLEKLNEDYLLYYFSDHGELINEGHGILNRGKDQYRIPLITIRNDSMPNVGEIIEKYYDKSTGIFNSLNTIYVLSEVMGYRIPQERIEQAKVDGRYVRQIDGSVCLFKDITE